MAIRLLVFAVLLLLGLFVWGEFGGGRLSEVT